MGKYILRRLLVAIPILLGITIIDFTFINLAPGDPIMAMVSAEAGSAQGAVDAERLRENLGLDKPVIVRYFTWLTEILQGNFGTSFSSKRPVLDRISERIGPTLVLTASAMFISLIVGIPLGCLAALKQYSKWDYILTVVAFAGISVPSFFLAMGAISIFTLQLRWLPAFGMATIGEPFSLLDRLRYLIMPAFILGLANTAAIMRYGRISLLEVLSQDYITTARAKGIREYTVVMRHAFRNALLPMITILALRLPGLFSGSVIIETIYSWPGIGQLSIEAINQRDYPQIMGLLLVTAVLVLLANLLADVAYAYADPRVRYE
ncbi:MAG: ABC transporter permease [Caldilineaceae bacterium]|nr:ABC transporter permease [Caldilineaceae bacterium]